jgi:lysophospholipid acyltransferase (LPLAT)-like uncharacterized protein
MKDTLLTRLSLTLVPPFYQAVTGLLFKSCRLEEDGLEYRARCYEAGPFIVAFWHYSTYYILQRGVGHRSVVAMVSASSDGEYVARLLERLGHATVRGSRGRGKQGYKALLEMAQWMTRGKMAAIVADGSQGPARIAQPGAIILASRTGAPILPTAWAADRYYVFNSWDRSILPKPFARIYLSHAEPLWVAPKIRGQELEDKRLELEDRLNNVYEKVWNRFDRKKH